MPVLRRIADFRLQVLIHGASYFTAVTDIAHANNYNRYLASTTNNYCKIVLMAVVLNDIHLA